MKAILLASSAVFLLAGSARAQWIVSDPAVETNTLQTLIRDVEAAAKRVEMINNQITQIQRLVDTVNAVAHGNVAAIANLSPELGELGLTSPLGNDAGALVQALGGLATNVGVTGTLAQQMLNTDRYYGPTGSDFRAAALNQLAVVLAQQKAMAELALQSSTQRLQSLTTLRNQLSSTPDVKASADATARLVGEQATTQAQTNQLIAGQILQTAQAATMRAREEQAWRCSAESLVADSQAAASAATSGTVTLVSTGSGSNCAAQASQTTVTAPTTGTAAATAVTSGTPGDGTVLGTMLAQPWGQTAASNAQALGVNPTALAATCAIESNCNAGAGGTGTITGAFQMTAGTYSETASAVQASNPTLAATMTGQSDPASQSIAASQYLLQGAQSLQARGIPNPTVLDVRSYYQFGPANAASVAQAADNQLMTSTLTGLSSATLAANNITASTTVGQWRQTVTSRLGTAASQPVLLGGQT